jgi:hypothetical protein
MLVPESGQANFPASRQARDMDIDPYDFNCVHCVQAYELRRRGMPAEATAIPSHFLPGLGTTGGRPLADIERVWNVRFQPASKREIVRAFKKFGNGARGIVAVLWQFGGGHVFNVENIGGGVQFLDPQTGEADVSRYFDYAEWTAYARLDDRTPGSGVLEFAAGEGSA